MSLIHVRSIQAVFKSTDAYVDYTWSVRRALSGWENDKRLAAYQRRRECAQARAA